jgi:hypothetical protein
MVNGFAKVKIKRASSDFELLMAKISIFPAIMLIFAVPVFGQECDYGVQLLAGSEFSQQNFTFKLAASKVIGPETNISSSVQITKDGSIVKEYFPWKNEKISRQKTSSQYSPNLPAGDYQITASLMTLCDDVKLSNNADSKKFRVIAGLSSNEKPDDAGKSFDRDEPARNLPQKRLSNSNEYNDYIYSREPGLESAENQQEYISSGEESRKIALYLLLLAGAVLAGIFFLKKN